jgi:hypothetical protein
MLNARYCEQFLDFVNNQFDSTPKRLRMTQKQVWITTGEERVIKIQQVRFAVKNAFR